MSDWKLCSKCKRELPNSNFYFRNGVPRNPCKACKLPYTTAAAKRWRESEHGKAKLLLDKPKSAVRAKKWRVKNAERSKHISARYVRKLRMEMLEFYGGPSPACYCCGEPVPEFLALDHKNGDGAVHRKKMGGNSTSLLYKWLKENDWPHIFRIACHNCNSAAGYYKRCPHQRQYSVMLGGRDVY